jgi:hypothetical protein
MTKGIYLRVSYRRGRPLAAYLTLPRMGNEFSVRSRKASPGLVVDYAADGRPIGIEITSPSIVTLKAVNDLLSELHQQTIGEEELAPLLAG